MFWRKVKEKTKTKKKKKKKNVRNKDNIRVCGTESTMKIV